MSRNTILDKLAKRKPKITLRKLDRGTILIEGNSAGLKFLGHLIIAHAHSHDCGDQMSPQGAGNQLFSQESTLGFYLHRIPCDHEPKKWQKRGSRRRP